MQYRNELSNRLLQFSVKIILFSRKLPVNIEFKIIKNQLIRSSTSAGANYVESQSTSSVADFRHKIRISLKEISESSYWIEILKEIYDDKLLNLETNEILKESIELQKILGKINKKVTVKK